MKNQMTFRQFLKASKSCDISDLGYFMRDAEKQFDLFPERLVNRWSGQYIFCYPLKRYLYIDKRLSQLVGRSVESILDQGLGLKDNLYFEPDDRVYDEKIFSANLEHFKEIAPEQHELHLVSCNYRIRHNRRLRNLQQESYFVRSDHHGKPLVVLGFVSDISHLWNNDRIVHTIFDANGNPYSKDYFSNMYNSKLTNRELAILNLSCEQLNMHDIADRLHVSYKTVDNIKQTMFKKLGVHTIVGAVYLGLKQGLIS